MPNVARRQLLVSLAGIGTAGASPFRAVLSGQGGSPPIRVRSLTHFGIAVPDPRRTIDFYQGLFGMPVQAHVGTTTILRVGAGPQFLSIRPVQVNASPSIIHYGLGVPDFNDDRMMTRIAPHGEAKTDAVGRLNANVTL